MVTTSKLVTLLGFILEKEGLLQFCIENEMTKQGEE
jgi:hypothetical protein